MLETVAFYISLLMAVLLFIRGYVEAIEIAGSTEKIYGGTLIFCLVFALIFSRLTYVFM
ncbi:hypothetical protein [Neobacillus sp. LXY-4]|uniref:hypothetical protein n=1 Tax=Neobacillus sp. LXY-4 TaxID=3379826 RepID=UPI003EDECEA7